MTRITATRTVSTASTSGLPRRLLGAPLRAGTYRNLLYLALAFPLGLAYFVGFVTAGALGVGLLVVWVGLPVLVATAAAARAVGRFEGHLATRLVGVGPASPPVARRPEGTVSGDGVLAAVRRLFTDPSTWTGLAAALVKFPVGVVALVSLVTGGGVAAAMLSAPLLYDEPSLVPGSAGALQVTGYTVGPWAVTTLPDALLVAAGGVVVLLVVLNLLNFLAWALATTTVRLLQVGTSGK